MESGEDQYDHSFWDRRSTYGNLRQRRTGKGYVGGRWIDALDRDLFRDERLAQQGETFLQEGKKFELIEELTE